VIERWGIERGEEEGKGGRKDRERRGGEWKKVNECVKRENKDEWEFEISINKEKKREWEIERDNAR